MRRVVVCIALWMALTPGAVSAQSDAQCEFGDFAASCQESSPASPSPGDQTRTDEAQEVTFSNGQLMLHGRLFKPDGAGPFPAILWNHGSERFPGPYLGPLARPFLAGGYLFFAPFRTGQGTSPGPYINEQVNAAPPDQRRQLQVQLLDLQVGDQLAGLNYLKSLAYVDADNIAVIGGSYGGIQTLLGAEANPGYRAAVDCSGASESWGNPLLRTRLLGAVAKIVIPVLLIQAQNDYTLANNQALAAQFQQLNKPVKATVYPAFGNGTVGQAGHDMCFRGAQVWAKDAIAFISGASGAA